MSAVAIVLIVVLVLLALVAGGLIWFLRRPLPKTKGTLHLPGLQGQVEVIRDRWGVPHIYADSAQDLFFAQGFVQAQDRMWQLELQRRLTAGRLSEILGEQTIEVDRLFRIVGLYRAAEAEVETLCDESRQMLEAYAAGVNAFIDSQKGRWSLEYSLLRFEPEPWQVADSLCWIKMMGWYMDCNWATELIRTRLAAKLGADLAADLEPIYPADNPPIVRGPSLPDGAEPPPNGWGSEALRDALQQVEELLQPAAPPPSAGALPEGLLPMPGNSNQWVVNGERSASGKPLLSNDTHLALQMPGAWYQVHLVGGGFNVSGVALPGLPTVAVGHNEHCAWGVTVAWPDCQDLYVEKLNPENSHQYEYRGEWLDAEVIREEIQVKGREEPMVQEVVVTCHGPIISEIVGEETPLALRWAALEPSDLMRATLDGNRARNWEEFQASLVHWTVLSLNFVYADVSGNIGYLQAGRVPIRAKGYGQAPVPGWTGEYEWQGYLSPDELPHTYNPESGWLATSNNLSVDDQYPHFLSSDFENPCRVCRAVDLITSKTDLTADDFARFQLDTYTAQGARFARHLLTIVPETEAERQALGYLERWDGHMNPDSVAASLYQVSRLRAMYLAFGGHLEELADSYVGMGLTPLSETTPLYWRTFVRLLDLLDGQGEDYWLRDPVTGQMRSRPSLLREALLEALVLLQEELGPEMDGWTWGRLNRVHFSHSVGDVKPLHLLFNRGPYPMGGDADTLLRASGKPGFPFEPAAVVDALRFIADLSDWEKCRIVTPGGQSGHPTSRHYADLIPLWREGRFQAMPFAREQVERYAEARLVLGPAAR